MTTTTAVTQGAEYALATHWTWNCSSCAPTITKDPNYTILLQSPNPSGGDLVLTEARVQSVASGKQSVTFSSSISYQYASVLITFKGATGGQSGVISGNVTNSAGTAIANATVSYSGGSTTATTNSNGAYTLSVAPGTYSVTVAAAGYPSSTQQNVTVITGATTTANFSLVQSTSTISDGSKTAPGTGGMPTRPSPTAEARRQRPPIPAVPTRLAQLQELTASRWPPDTLSSTQQNVAVFTGTTTTVNFTLTIDRNRSPGRDQHRGCGDCQRDDLPTAEELQPHHQFQRCLHVERRSRNLQRDRHSPGTRVLRSERRGWGTGTTTTVNFTLTQSTGTGVTTIQAADKFQSGTTSFSLASPITGLEAHLDWYFFRRLRDYSDGFRQLTNKPGESAFGYVTSPNTNGQVRCGLSAKLALARTHDSDRFDRLHDSQTCTHANIRGHGLSTSPVDATGSSDSGSASVTTQTATTTTAVTQGAEYALATHWTWNCSSCAPTITKDPNYTILLQSPNPEWRRLGTDRSPGAERRQRQAERNLQ